MLAVKSLPGVNPYTDFVEVMCYFSENFPDDYEKYYSGLDKNKIMLGLGLSSYSYTEVPTGTNPDCPGSTTITNDWFDFCPPPNNPCSKKGSFPSWNEIDPNKQYKYDFYLEKIRKKEAKYILSQATNWQGHRTPYLYFPQGPSYLPFNGFDRIERYAKKVIDNGYKGIFTWIASSDSVDGIFHRKIYEYLNLYPYLTCGSETAYCDMHYMSQNYGWFYEDDGQKQSLGVSPPINDPPYSERAGGDVPKFFVNLRNGRALDSKGLLCPKNKYGDTCQYTYCGDWTVTHPNQAYAYSTASAECPAGKSCDASTGNCI